MRIKSYFSASVQSAIALARAEFGDNITLVTSHISALESRHLGEYEVVFAIEEASEPAEETEPATRDTFQTALGQAIAAKPSIQENLPKKLEELRSLLIEMGIEPAMVRALMTMAESCVRPVRLDSPPQAEPTAREAQPESMPEIISEARPEPLAEPLPRTAAGKNYSPAERAFVLSVSKPGQDIATIAPKWALGA
jgi:hypothetical protein